MRRSADLSKKHVFCGEKGQDPEQNTDLETKIKMPRGTPKATIQSKNPEKMKTLELCKKMKTLISLSKNPHF